MTINHFTNYAVFATNTAQTTTSTPATAATAFSDVPSSYWGYDAITSLSSKGIASGYPDGTFRPDNHITRAEFATMLVKALGLSNQAMNVQFSDVTSGDWFYNSVNAAVYPGMACGVSNDMFEPKALINREEMAVMVAKALGTDAPMVNGTELSSYSDSSSVSSWAVSGMEKAVQAGIVSGMTADTLASQADATRAQAAAMVYKLHTILGK